MDKNHASASLSPAGFLPTQEEQVPASSSNSPARKRQLNSDDNDDAAAAELQTKRARTTRSSPEPVPARLTRKNLALFDKMGRGNSKKTSTHRDSDDTNTSKSLSTTAPGFAVQAYKNGILNPLDSKAPTNLEEIRQRLAQSRTTASPPESVFEEYVQTVREAPNEATMVGEMLPLFQKYPKGYKRVLNQAFTAFPKDMGFNSGLSAPQPDYVEGLGMEEFRPFPVDQHVSGAVLSKDNPRSVTLSHLAGEWTGPGGDITEAQLQSGYDGAALVYARNQALSYQGTPDPLGHAHITTFTTNGTHLNFYAHYATTGDDGTTEYHQFPVNSTSLVNSYGEHKQGRRSLRNAQDYARKQSYELRDQLKEHYRKQRGGGGGDGSGLPPVAEGAPSLPIAST